MPSTLTNRGIIEAIFDTDTFHSPEYEYQFRSEDFTAEIPQTGERFDSREALRDMQREFGPPPGVTLKRITGEGNIWVVETVQNYEGDGEYHTCVIVEFDNGKISRETRYYGPPIQTGRTL